MKETELRIGNYISNQDGTLRGIPIGEPHIVDKTDFKWAEMYVPIPLTEEWLLKFGFELKDKINMGFIKQINFPHMKNYLYVNSKYYTTALWDEISQKEFLIMLNPCQYVHQLQNLYFALTNEELTIKN